MEQPKDISETPQKHTVRMQVTGVPKPLREDFRKACDKKGLTEASVIKNFIHGFVKENTQGR